MKLTKIAELRFVLGAAASALPGPNLKQFPLLPGFVCAEAEHQSCSVKSVQPCALTSVALMDWDLRHEFSAAFFCLLSKAIRGGSWFSSCQDYYSPRLYCSWPGIEEGFQHGEVEASPWEVLGVHTLLRSSVQTCPGELAAEP